MLDRDVVRAAARDVRTLMRRRQANEQARAGADGRVVLDPKLLALALECDDVAYSKRAQADDLAERLAAVLGDEWEP